MQKSKRALTALMAIAAVMMIVASGCSTMKGHSHGKSCCGKCQETPEKTCCGTDGKCCKE